MRAGRHPTARHGVDLINHEINKNEGWIVVHRHEDRATVDGLPATLNDGEDTRSMIAPQHDGPPTPLPAGRSRPSYPTGSSERDHHS